MFKNWRMGTFLKVPVELNASLLIVIAILAAAENMAGIPVYAQFLLGILKGVILYASVLGHEYGHVLAARKYGFSTQKIVLMVLGGVAYIDMHRMKGKPKTIIKVAAAGPAVSVLLALIPFGIAMGLGAMFDLTMGNVFIHILVWAFAINAMLAVFNILPITPLDGGRIYQALLSMKFSLVKASKIAFVTTIVLSLGLLVGGAIVGAYGAMILAPILVFVAFQERKDILDEVY
jgi:Zn-dependent protease